MKKNIELPWIEKYRPNEMETIMLNNFLKEKIDTILSNKTIPNLVLTGEPGTGKTSTMLILIKELYGNDYKDDVLELNASDDRGLSIISSTIIPFCQKKTSNKQKIIILDEADSITNKAQQLLNTVITEYKSKCRFVFICNDISKINEPILSKCLVITYPKLPYNDIVNKLLDICQKENINYTKKNIEKLIHISNNDIRKSINNLECIHKTFNEITEKNILLLFDINKVEYIKKILLYCMNKDFKNAIKLTTEIYNNGYNINDIVLSILDFLFSSSNDIILNDDKMELYSIVSKIYIEINNGNDTLLQLYGCISQIYLYYVN